MQCSYGAVQMQTIHQPSFSTLATKTIAAHTVTYFLMGVLAYYGLDYAERFTRPEMACWMRQTDDPIVMAGPLFQPIRGFIFALAFYPLREIFFGQKKGWLIMWWTLVALGILSTFGPPPGSIEGVLYTLIPISDQLTGWLEVVPQALLLSVVLCYWVDHPERQLLNWVMGGAFCLVVLFPVLGLLAR
jgi:hypothetical protein